MAKKNDVVLDEIDAFLEQEKSPKKKRSKKEEVIIEEVEEEEKVEVVPEVKKRGRKKKEEVQVEEVKEEPIVEEVKEVKKEKKVKEKKNVTVDEEDLYLTQSFKPLKTRKRLKKSVVRFFRNLIIFGILGVLAFFGYTKVKDMYNMLKPVNVYKEFVKGFEETAIEMLDELPIKNNFKIEVDVNTNIEDYKFFNDNNMTYNFNLREDGYEDFLAVNGKGAYTLKNSESTYIKFSNSDNVIEAKDKYSSMLTFITSVLRTKEDAKDIVEGNSKVIINILEEEDIKSKDESLTINDEELNVKCHTLELTDDLINRYLVELFKDDKLVETMAEFADLSIDEFKKDFEDSLLKYKNKININLYVDKFELAGFDVEVDGFREGYLYVNGEEFDCKINGLYSFIGLEGTEADFRLSSKNIDDDTAVLLEEKENMFTDEFEYVYAEDNTKMTVTNNRTVYEYKKGDKFVNVVVNYSEGEVLNLTTDNLITSQRTIDKETKEFDKLFNNNESAVFLFENLYIYGG